MLPWHGRVRGSIPLGSTHVERDFYNDAATSDVANRFYTEAELDSVQAFFSLIEDPQGEI
jgi:hypothetical protein